LLPMIVFTSLVLFGGEDAPITPVSKVSEQKHQDGGSSQDPVIDQRPSKAAISFDVHILPVRGQNSANKDYIGFGIQHLLNKAFDQYPAVESGSPIQASLLKGKGIESPSGVTLPLYQEMSLTRRSDLMLTGEVELDNEERLAVTLTIYRVDPLESVWQTQFLTSEVDLFARLDIAVFEIANAIQDQYDRSIVPIADIPTVNFGSVNLEAFRAFSQSRYFRYWQLQKASAIDFLRKALERDPRFGYAWWTLARHLDSSTDTAEIESALRSTLKFDDRLSVEDGYYIRLTYQNFRQPDNEARLELLTKFKSDFPFNTRPRELLADFHWQAGQYNEALVELDELIDYLPADNPSAHHTKGHIFQAQNKFAEAALMFEHVAKLKPDEPKSWYDLADTYQSMLRFDEASEHFQRMLKAGDGAEDPFYLRKYYEFSMCQGDVDEAFKYINEMALWSDGEQEQLQLENTKANFYDRTGQVNKLREQIEKIRGIERQRLETEQERVLYDARSSLIDVRLEMREGKLQQAERRLISARSLLNSEINIGTRALEYGLALQALRENKQLQEITPEESWVLLSDFLKTRNPNFDKHDRLMHEASYLQATGKPDKAEQTLLQLLKLNPGDVDHFISLAEIAVEQNKPSKAVDYLNQGPAWCPYRVGPMLIEAQARIDMENTELASELLQRIETLLANASESINETKRLRELQAQLNVDQTTLL
ncbi:MAG: tetratricopeptide repeat protein, partial [Opitutae bacterium]